MQIKRPGENLCPIAAVVYYLVIKGGIPQNVTYPDLKKLIGDDFLYEEIIEICPNPYSMSQNLSLRSTSYRNGPTSLKIGKSYMSEEMSFQFNDQLAAESSIVINPPIKSVTCPIFRQLSNKRGRETTETESEIQIVNEKRRRSTRISKNKRKNIYFS